MVCPTSFNKNWLACLASCLYVLLALQGCAAPTPPVPASTPALGSTSTPSRTLTVVPPSAATPTFSREQAIQRATESAGYAPSYLHQVEKRIDSVTAELITLAEMDERFYGEQRLSYAPGQDQATKVWLLSVRGYFGFEQKGMSGEQPQTYMADGHDLVYDVYTGQQIAGRRLGLGVVVVPPLAPKIGDQVVPTPASRVPIAGEEGVWDLVARWVRGVLPVLRLQSLPPGLEYVQMLDVGQGTFRVEYTGPGKRVMLGAGAFNPPMVTPESGGEQRRVTVRGQGALLQVRSRAQPSESVQLVWQEPGKWIQAADAPTMDHVFYMISAQGLDPDGVLQLANLLSPM